LFQKNANLDQPVSINALFRPSMMRDRIISLCKANVFEPHTSDT